MQLEQYSIGVGDRFGREGAAQLRALAKARSQGLAIAPVWNKSNREHLIIGTTPDATRQAADEAVRASRWTYPYYLDADHIGLGTVDRFLSSCNFFTIDVADAIGTRSSAAQIAEFVQWMKPFIGPLVIPGMQAPVQLTKDLLEGFASNYLAAMHEAGEVYRHIALAKGAGAVVPEVSVDEAGTPQTPVELFLILAAIARERIPVQTIAPKFTGAFLKGVDYVGDLAKFTAEFDDDLAVVAFAVEALGLPGNLKLSIHSGSDKFSLYPVMHSAMKRRKAGLHLKTAGTTWLEEVIGLAASGGEGLRMVKEMYRTASGRYDELCKPYLSVVSIDRRRLPAPADVAAWSSGAFVEALRHDQSCPGYNRDFRQLVHVSFRVAAEMGPRFSGLLQECRTAIEENVEKNIFDRHIVPLFLGGASSAIPRG